MTLYRQEIQQEKAQRLAILGFKNKIAASVAEGRPAKGFPSDLLRTARRKLAMIDAAPSLRSLEVPPGNRLNTLHGEREGQHAIRVNDQFRICFRWTEQGPDDVEIVDYH